MFSKYIYFNFTHQPVFSFKNHRLLVIAPHADDEVLGCGGLISRVKKDGGKVFVLIFNVGSVASENVKKLTQTKKKETAAAMKFLKVDNYDIIYDTPEDNRYLDAKPLHKLIEKIELNSKVSLMKTKPTIVAIPTLYSHHQDHVSVHNACVAALRPLSKPNANMVISYEAPEHSRWSSNGVFEPNFYVDIESFLSKKITAFYKYKSQIRDGGRDKNTILTQAMYRGKEVGKNFCEGFFVHRQLV